MFDEVVVELEDGVFFVSVLGWLACEVVGRLEVWRVLLSIAWHVVGDVP